MSILFSPFTLSGLTLRNRVVMAPMTRARALNDIPDDLTVLYYRQRASAGLIISMGRLLLASGDSRGLGGMTPPMTLIERKYKIL